MRKRQSTLTLAIFALMVSVLVATPSAQAGRFVTQAALDAASALANDPMFASVGYIEAWDSGGSFMAGGGVLVAPNWVLTAGHVALDDTTGDGLFLKYEFSLNNNFFDLPTNGVLVDEVHIYPGYSEVNCGPGLCVDLALIRLSTPINSVLSAVIGTAVIGDHFYAAGFGRPGVGITVGAFDGILRAGENTIDKIGNGTNVNSNYFLAEFDTVQPLPMEWSGTQFDSGGGWFNDSGELIAISNLVAGTSTGGIRLAEFGTWLNGTTGLNLVAIPEPGTFVLLGAGVVALSSSRRSRHLS